MDGKTAVKGHEAEVDLTPGQIFEGLQLGAMGYFETRKARWAMRIDVTYVALGTDVNRPPGNVYSNQGAYTFTQPETMPPLKAAGFSLPGDEDGMKFVLPSPGTAVPGNTFPRPALLPDQDWGNSAPRRSGEGSMANAGTLAPVDAGLLEPVRPRSGIRWGNVAAQSLLFLGIEHGFRLLDPKQPYTRAALKGPFFKDWFDTVKDLKGWSDSDDFIINYVGHPVQGAVSGRILVQNDPHSLYAEPGYNRAYGGSCLKAFGFAFLYSLQFELGPISEASIGNSKGTPFYPHPTSYVDLVVTPTVGTGWMVGEDLADHHLIATLERKISSRTLTLLIRSLSNPSRTMANALRFKWPWYRDDRF
jgi:hypothetical protein